MAFGFGAGVQRLGSVAVDTLAALNALAPAANVRPTGFVYADPAPANNGVYTWSGAAWAKQRGLPDGVAAFEGVGGTGNVITAAPASGVDPAVCKVGVLTPTAANTGAVTLNGEAIKDRTGNPLAAGALAAGVSTILLRDGAAWRLLTGNVAEISDVSGLQAALNTKIDAPAMAAAIASAINGLVNGAGSALDTLNELAAALGNDPNFSTTILTTLGAANQILNATDTGVSNSDHIGFRRFSDGTYIKRTVAQLTTFLASTFASKTSGNTFTQNQRITKASAYWEVNKNASGETMGFSSFMNGLQRWQFRLGNDLPEAGGNAGSDLDFRAYDDAGASLGSHLTIKRSDGTVTGASLATTAQARAASAGRLLQAGAIDAAAQPVNLGAALTGNLTLTMDQFYNAYGTATGNIVFSAIASPMWRGGTIEITASGGDRTVGFNTAAFATPKNKALKTILSGTTQLYSFTRAANGKVVIVELGTYS